MGKRIVQILGNGDSCHFYKAAPRPGLKLTCNLPPFAMSDPVYATTIVDFKMMNAIAKQEIVVPGQWVLGMRPKVFMDKSPAIHIRHAHQIKQFYTTLPKYCPNYTDLSCGHFAAHYAATTFKPDEIHIYGFDSIFDFNLRSSSDFYMHSDRENMNNYRLSNNWRPLWTGIWNEFKNIKFVLHYFHDNIAPDHGDNVEVVVYKKEMMKKLSADGE